MKPILRTTALLLTIAFALAASFGPATASAAQKGVDTDLTWGISGKQQDRTVAGVRDIGAKWVRLTLSWADVEQTEGSYSGSALSQYDTAITKATSSGAKVVVTVYQSPQWASGRTNPESPPTDPQDFANFMRFAAIRWGDRVDAWEIWNEQNSAWFWSTGPSPSGYARLLKAAYPAVKIADPTARVVYGGVVRNDYRFIEQSYAAEPNLGDYYDVMATHPYPTPANTSPALTWLESDGRLSAKSFASYSEVREVMLANGDNKPLWFTEFGWATTTITDFGVSEDTQAAYLTLAMQCLERDPYVEVAIWHSYRNTASADTWNDQLGLVRTGFSRKRSYDAFQGYTPGNTGCTYQFPPPPPAPEPDPEPDPSPDPSPEPTPEPDPTLEPDPTAEPADEDEPADEPELDEEEAESSSERAVELRVERLGGSASRGSGRVRIRLEGDVTNTRRGRIDLRVACRARGDSDWRRSSFTRKLDLSRNGEYETVIRPRRRAACRTRASYYAFGVLLARSPIVSFKT